MTFLSRVGSISMVGAWFTAAMWGVSRLHSYSNTASPVGRIRERWPVGSTLVASSTKSTFIIFLHPHCPCSRASVAAMKEVMAQFPGVAEYHAVFVRPVGVSAEWVNSELYQACKSNQQLVTSIDNRGVEAAKFGAQTSGQTYIYNSAHLLTFSGGITPGRGMEGKGPERKQLESALTKNLDSPLHSPTYGCSLI